MNHKLPTLPLLILMGAFVMAEDKPQSLFEFTGADAAKDWQPVNDGVVGDVSEGKFQITDMQTVPNRMYSREPRLPINSAGI
ncbi:MAG: hypothetical protein KF777_03780 [Planctomycetaceae bacterium]|nr:hypothetical protein [Planctomycetaceae bacterium]